MPHREDTENLIEALASDAAPVRLLWSPAARLAIWTAVHVAFAAYVFSTGIRADIDVQMTSPAFATELLLLVAAAGLFAAAALRAAVPGAERRGVAQAGALFSTAALAFLAAYPADTSLPLATFTAIGFPCAVRTTTLSLLPTLWLLVAIRRGLPLSPVRAALLAGAAGFLVGYTMMRVLCILDDPLHVGAWHWLPVILGSATAACVGALLSRRATPAR